MNQQINIRAAVPADAAGIKNAHRASIRNLCRGHYTAEQIQVWSGRLRVQGYRNAMNRGEKMYVAKANGRIIGFSALIGKEVRAVYVHPKFAKKGVGKKLLAAVELAARRMKLKILRLNSSLNAVPFYQSHGYKTLRRTTHLIGTCQIPCIAMRKNLDE